MKNLENSTNTSLSQQSNDFSNEDLICDDEGLQKVGSEILLELYEVISDRKINKKEGSYTNYLFDKGLDKILKKVGEEASEVIIAAKNGSFQELRYEISDLFYHVFVLMVEQGLKLEDVYVELKNRR